MDDQTESVEIPIWVNGKQKWITGITKSTTCDDIVYALLCNEGSQAEDLSYFYSIFERWRDIERKLQGRTKILKIWRSWGIDQKHIKLSLKRADELSYSGEHSYRNKRHKRSRTSGESRTSSCFCSRCVEKKNLHLDSISGELKKRICSQDQNVKDLYEKILYLDKAIAHEEQMLATSSKITRLRNKTNCDDEIKALLHNIDPNKHCQYLQLCDKLLTIEEHLHQERIKISALFRKIENEMRLKSDLTESMKVSQSFDELKRDNAEAISRGVFLAMELEQLFILIDGTNGELLSRREHLNCLLTEYANNDDVTEKCSVTNGKLNLSNKDAKCSEPSRIDENDNYLTSFCDDQSNREESKPNASKGHELLKKSFSDQLPRPHGSCKDQSSYVNVSTLTADYSSYLTVTSCETGHEENDSDTGLSSMNSDEISSGGTTFLETLV